MENLIVIVILGKNGIFKKGGYPFHYNDSEEYINYFLGLINGYPILLSEETYDDLPEKSPPLHCPEMYVITADTEAVFKPKLTDTLIVVFNLDKALALCENAVRIIILVDYPLYNEVFYDHHDQLEYIIVVRLDEYAEGTDVFKDPPFDWVPVIIKECPEFTITKYTFHPCL